MKKLIFAFVLVLLFTGCTLNGEQVIEDDYSQTGILPFDSGVIGKVFLGPICPVIQNPLDPNCADKPYATTVQIIEIGSPKSSPFSVVETDKDGNYKVLLPPGEYGLQAVGERPFPWCETKDVIVEPGLILEVDLFCDSGIG